MSAILDAIADPTTAIVTLLREDTIVQEIAGERIFGDTLPDGQTKPSVTVQPVPGLDFHTISVTRQTLQIQCWGGTERGAGRIAMQLALVVKRALNVTLVDANNVRVFWATITGSPGLLHDPDSQQAYATLFADVAVQSTTV